MLDIKNIRTGYGAINVLWDVSLTAKAGQLTTIIGPNGAGKTTLLRAIMGLLPLSQGEIVYDKKVIDGTATWNMAALGVVMIPEGRMIFRDMTIEENLMMGAFPKQHRAHAQRNCERAYAMFPALHKRRHLLAGTLSGGEGQMLAMARGLMSDPRLLIIDEPSLGLAPVVVNELFETLKQLKADGRSIILVEQNTQMALALADQVYLMQSGKVVFSKPAGEVSLSQLQDLYFGR